MAKPREIGNRGAESVGMLLELIMPRTTDLEREIPEHVANKICQ